MKNKPTYNFFIPCTLLIILVTLFFIFASRKPKEEENVANTNIAESIPSFAVTVKTPYYTGQGVVYATDENIAYVVTTGHLTEGITAGEFCTVTLHDGTESDAVLIYCSETADVAFLMLEMQGKVETVPQNREQFDRLQAESLVTAYSMTNGALKQSTGTIIEPWIYLEDFSLDMMLVKMDAEAGMSGCAVLDEEGCFAGVLCGVSETGEAAVLPFSIIESEWIMTGRERDS
ncbi:MAG: trypsin-like peptidase domain-containing protein [Lachnospiraceae bacterium]|nr:trypsin-like peptidase domain-containing protein [Lachnospiraceae bacterium]